MPKSSFWSLHAIVLLAGLPAHATVRIVSMTPSLAAPQPIGSVVTWTATATDSNPGPLTFQFNVALPRKSLSLAQDFNVGVLNTGTWTSSPFIWVPTSIEGQYKIQ